MSESVAYILTNPESTWTEYTEAMQAYPEEIEHIDTEEEAIAVAISLPGKKYIYRYAKRSAGFTIEDVANKIEGDPLLGELGAEKIYTFLDASLRAGDREEITDLDENNVDQELETHDHVHTGISIVNASKIKNLDSVKENYLIINDKRVCFNVNTKSDFESLGIF